MKNLGISSLLAILLFVFTAASCSLADKDDANKLSIVFPKGSYPNAVKDGSTYYYMMPDNRPGHLSIYSASSLDSLCNAVPVTVWESDHAHFQNIWSPELHKINGRWYIYFEADNGNTDNHHIYVLECNSPDPQSRQWDLHGPIMVYKDWNYGIHPSTFTVDDRQYMVWSGWEKRRLEVETQCIFIAEMENPWTLKSERVLISRPEYEWERQWINPDGSRSAYPIFVNENPEPYISPDGKNVVIAYSSSGIWTIFSTLGMLHASTESDLLNPNSWTKNTEPVFISNGKSKYGGVSNITLIPDVDDKGTIMLFQAKELEGSVNLNDAIIMKKIDWKDSLPVFGEY